MSKNTTLKPLAIAMGAAFVTSLAGTGVANAAENPFAMSELSSGYMVADTHAKGEEGKCGEQMKSKEGKCGEQMKSKEGKCGEGKCGEQMKSKEGKCGEGKCGEQMKSKEGKCGEQMKSMEGGDEEEGAE
jgi:uncharacterized low-complexity protein